MMRLAEAMEAAADEIRADSDHAPDSIPRFTLEQNGMRERGHHRTNTTQSPFAPLVFLPANPTVKQSWGAIQ